MTELKMEKQLHGLNVLVTGADGFISSHLCKYLAENGVKWVPKGVQDRRFE